MFPRGKQLERDTLHAAPSERFDQLLAALSIDKLILRGTAKCKFCGTPLTNVADIAAVFPQSGAIKLVCDQPKCVMALADLVAEDPTLL